MFPTFIVLVNPVKNVGGMFLAEKCISERHPQSVEDIKAVQVFVIPRTYPETGSHMKQRVVVNFKKVTPHTHTRTRIRRVIGLLKKGFDKCA